MTKPPVDPTRDPKHLVATALSETVEFLAAEGHTLTPEQSQKVQARLEPIILEIFKEDPDAIPILTRACALQIVGEVLGLLLSSEPRPVNIPLGLELTNLAGQEINRRITEGQYPSFTESQRNLLTRVTAKHVANLVSSARTHEQMRAAVLEWASVAVTVAMGVSPRSARMN